MTKDYTKSKYQSATAKRAYAAVQEGGRRLSRIA